ncbi:hypothetical protein [Mesorhizobium sp. WSM3873]
MARNRAFVDGNKRTAMVAAGAASTATTLQLITARSTNS